MLKLVIGSSLLTSDKRFLLSLAHKITTIHDTAKLLIGDTLPSYIDDGFPIIIVTTTTSIVV